MSKNKCSLIRYIAIDKCLSRGRHTLQEIKEEVDKAMIDVYGHSASLRTVRQDIYEMKDRMLFDAPIEIKRLDNNFYYYYTVPGYCIFTKNK